MVPKLEKKVTDAMVNEENELTTINIHKPFAKSLRVLGRAGDTMEDVLKILYNFYLKENEFICRMCGSGMEEHDQGEYVCIACGHTYNKNSKVKK